jgi:hypothetical protein
MKLGKEEIQKMILGGLLMIGLLYSYFFMLLGPMKLKRAQNEGKITEYRAKIMDAKKQLKRVQQVKAEAPQHALVVKQIGALIPEGAPVAWFPVRVTDVFRQYGVDRTVTKLTGEVPDKMIPGYKRLTWGVELTKSDFIITAEAIAGFENSELLAEISGLQIETSLEDIATQRILLTVNNVVTQ